MRAQTENNKHSIYTFSLKWQLAGDSKTFKKLETFYSTYNAVR
jgi:hypothetical protein